MTDHISVQYGFYVWLDLIIRAAHIAHCTLSCSIQPTYLRCSSLRKEAGFSLSHTPISSMQTARISGTLSRYRWMKTPLKIPFIIERKSSWCSSSCRHTLHSIHNYFYSTLCDTDSKQPHSSKQESNNQSCKLQKWCKSKTLLQSSCSRTIVSASLHKHTHDELLNNDSDTHQLRVTRFATTPKCNKSKPLQIYTSTIVANMYNLQKNIPLMLYIAAKCKPFWTKMFKRHLIFSDIVDLMPLRLSNDKCVFVFNLSVTVL